MLVWRSIQHQGCCAIKWYGSAPTSGGGSWANILKWHRGKFGGVLLFKQSVICTQKHGRLGRKTFSRILVAATQCDRGAPGRTISSAINLGKRSTSFIKKAVKTFWCHLYISIKFPPSGKSIEVTMRPNWIREGQSINNRIILSNKSVVTRIFNLKTINVKKISIDHISAVINTINYKE